LPWSKSSLDKSYDKAKADVFSMDDQLVGCILIFSSPVQLPLSLPPAIQLVFDPSGIKSKPS
jgi:hypothetical protein